MNNINFFAEIRKKKMDEMILSKNVYKKKKIKIFYPKHNLQVI
jgi:hypothetical protein